MAMNNRRLNEITKRLTQRVFTHFECVAFEVKDWVVFLIGKFLNHLF